MAATVAALRLPAELWTLILEDVVGWSARRIDVPALEEARVRNGRLLPLTLVCRALRPLAQELLFRELATGARRAARWTRSDLQHAALLRTLQDLTARGSPLPGRVRCLYVVVGVGGTDHAQRLQGGRDMAFVGQLLALCPALRFLDVLLADPYPHGDALSIPPDALPAVRAVPLRQLLVRIDDALPRAWTLPAPWAVFDFVLQALAEWPGLHTLLLRVPAQADGALGAPPPPPCPGLRELRVAGVPPRALMLAATGLQTLVLVDPALAEHPADTVFGEALHVPAATRELVFIADCGAYTALDLSAAHGLRVLSVEWAECADDTALDRLVRVLDEAEYLPGGLRLHTLRLPLAMCVFADLADALRTGLVALRRTLGEVLRVVLAEVSSGVGVGGLLERLGSSQDEMRATIRAIFEGAEVEFTRERFVDPEWKSLPRVN